MIVIVKKSYAEEDDSDSEGTKLDEVLDNYNVEDEANSDQDDDSDEVVLDMDENDIHQEIQENFKDFGLESEKILSKKNAQGSPQSPGPAGLALYYENVVNQRYTVLRFASKYKVNFTVQPSIISWGRGAYCPTDHSRDGENFNVACSNSYQYNQSTSWVWMGWRVGNTGSALDPRLPGHNELTLVQTFHNAEKERTKYYIFELIVWLQNHM